MTSRAEGRRRSRTVELTEYGREKMTLAEHEMLGLMNYCKVCGAAQLSKGLHINGSMHVATQT